VATCILILEAPSSNLALAASMQAAFLRAPLYASDDASALRLARACDPDAILCDVERPGFDAHALLQALKHDPSRRPVPVLALGALRLEGERERLLAAGFDACIDKQDAPQAVLRALEAWLPAESAHRLGLGPGALAELGIALGAERDPVALFEAGCRAALALCAARFACVGVFAPGADALRYACACGDSGAAPWVAPAPRAGVLAALLEQGRALRLDGAAAGPAALGFAPGHRPMHAFLGVPLAARGQLHGWLYLADKRGAERFDEADEHIAVTVGAELAAAYGNLLLYEQIRDRHAALTAELAERVVLDANLERFRNAMDATADAIFLIERAGTGFVDVNATACDLLGYRHAQFMSAGPPVPPAPGMDVELGCLRRLCQRLAGDGSPGRVELQVLNRGGSQLSLEVQRRSIGGGASALLVVVARDVSVWRRAEQRLLRLSHFDGVTGLLNRAHMFDALNRALTPAAEQRWPLGVLFLDIDHFKSFNLKRGRDCGDELLRLLGNRLVDSLRARDIVGRLGADEFVAVLMLPNGGQTAATVVETLRAALREPFNVLGREHIITASIGISIYPDNGVDAEALIRHAGTAMREAKQAGRDAFRFFTVDMNAQALARAELEEALRAALVHEQFVLHFQPKADLRSGRISGVEALLRWQRPGDGLIAPAQFVPLLEETGLIVAVGAWVLQQACRRIAAWSNAGFAPLPLSVNVSAVQFVSGFEQAVSRAIGSYGIAPELLELELTERALMTNAEQAIGLLRKLKEIGVRIAIDDFGTGYSSLAYLKRFPIDTLKIDIAFVREVASDPDDAAIVRAITSMAHSMRLKVTAEGVETDAQLACLRRHGCDEMQGYFLSPPLALQPFEQLLRAARALPAPLDERHDGLQTLLIVDDDPFMVEVLVDFLAQDRYRIVTATSAAEGFAVLARHEVQVILCDQCMPGMNGTEFFERVKLLYPETFRIILSAYTDLVPIMVAINGGALDRFYTKPWKGAVLRENIRDGFRLHGLLRREGAALN
jgi:diguanylate cyclase (GGDEF)-like protein/PAS domain S-box-containing protein